MKNVTKESAPAKRIARSPKITVPLTERAALSPNEFAAVFGKANTWGYRLIYSGKVKVIKDLGRMMIPGSELKRLLASAEVFA
jgi:hypothetical protein